MIVLAQTGFEVLYWHPATKEEPGRLESAPVIAWEVTGESVAPITPRGCLNATWRSRSPTVGPTGLLYPDGRVDTHNGRFTPESIDAFVSRAGDGLLT
jgi:hypothetical protein